MPVTVKTAHHPAREYGSLRTDGRDRGALFLESCPKQDIHVKAIVRSSLDGALNVEGEDFNIDPSPNGFVRAALSAYSDHHHLIIRPEDVWLSVLSQLSFYISAHAEELRKFFVPHEGRVNVTSLSPNVLADSDLSWMAVALAEALGKCLNDPDLHAWIMPDFSTTTDTDRVVALVMMMGTFRDYFNAGFSFLCGIPSVTLLGAREDWVRLAARLDRIPQLGDEPAQFCRLLEPIMRYLVRSFDEPENLDVVDFWGRIAHQSRGSGVSYISGWITAFCFWEANGKLLYRTPNGPVEVKDKDLDKTGCILDGVPYHRVDSGHIPIGSVTAPVTVDDNGIIYHAAMVAGSLGIRITSSGQALDNSHGHREVVIGGDGRRVPDLQPRPLAGARTHQESSTGPDTLQPVTGWFFYDVDVDVDDPYGYWAVADESEWVPAGLAKRVRDLQVDKGNVEPRVPPAIGDAFKPRRSWWKMGRKRPGSVDLFVASSEDGSVCGPDGEL